MGIRAKDISGKQFGFLKVEKWVGTHITKGGYKQALWECTCLKCGKSTTVTYKALKEGQISCGCYIKERLSKGELQLKHGLSHSPLYKVLKEMYSRCYYPQNKNYHHYGGRGISICDQWNKDIVGIEQATLNFIAWAEQAGYSKGLTIDRMDNDGDYEPDNCRWITMAEQQRNKGRAA